MLSRILSVIGAVFLLSLGLAGLGVFLLWRRYRRVVRKALEHAAIGSGTPQTLFTVNKAQVGALEEG